MLVRSIRSISSNWQEVEEEEETHAPYLRNREKMLKQASAAVHSSVKYTLIFRRRKGDGVLSGDILNSTFFCWWLRLDNCASVIQCYWVYKNSHNCLPSSINE